MLHLIDYINEHAVRLDEKIIINGTNFNRPTNSLYKSFEDLKIGDKLYYSNVKVRKETIKETRITNIIIKKDTQHIIIDTEYDVFIVPFELTNSAVCVRGNDLKENYDIKMIFSSDINVIKKVVSGDYTQFESIGQHGEPNEDDLYVATRCYYKSNLY